MTNRRSTLVILRPVIRLAFLAFAVGLMLGLLVPKLFAAGSSQSGVPTVHVVSTGETLWSLASELDPEDDPREFVLQVQRLNGLEGAQIFPGQKLVLPPS